MQRLYQAMLLKKLYLLQACGMEYCNPLFIKPSPQHFLAKDSKMLEGLIQKCLLCPQKSSLPNAGLYNSNSQIVFVSLFPLLDFQQRFASKSAEMLHKIITNVFGLSLKEVSLLSLLKCEIPAQNLQESLEMCLGYFYKQLQFTQSKIIVALGKEAYFHLSGDGTPYEKVRGKILEWKEYLLMPTFSLLELLQRPNLKIQAHKDFLTLKSHLKEHYETK